MKRVLCLIAVMVLVAPFSGAGDRNISGSTLVYTSHTMNSPTDVDVVFTATNASTDFEYLDQVTITLPAPWTVVSVTAGDFDATGGDGTSQATATDSGYPCSGLGKSCSGGCDITVKINPNGNMDPGVPVTWMIEGDFWGADLHVVCSVGDSCVPDVCYGGSIDATGLDIDMEPVPVELMTFSIE